jgi:O-succinylbenzoate synthase
MIIERVDIRHISQQLVSPFGTSFGTQVERPSIILTLYSEGLAGWGECVASTWPGYSYETVTTAWHVLSDFLIPALLGEAIEEPEEVAQRLSFVRGHPLAKATLDQAAWDITAQRDGLSMAEKLALPYPEGPGDRVKVGVSIGTQESVERTLDVIAEHLEKGYGRIKLKIKPGHDMELARAATSAFPDVPIMLDANSAYQLSDAPLFQAMDGFNLLMLEQPLAYEDIYDHSQLRPQIRTPLCLDESIHSADDARLAVAIEACDIINIKPARVSGWTEARKIHDVCVDAGVRIWVGGMLETGVGRAGQLALASLPGFSLHCDISATERYYAHDIATPFLLNREDSTLSVPKGPGLGVEVDFKHLEAITIRKASFP